jgi:hypothetical protein
MEGSVGVYVMHAYISYYHLFVCLVCIWNLLGRSFSIHTLIACDCCKFLGRTEQEYTRLVVIDRNMLEGVGLHRLILSTLLN